MYPSSNDRFSCEIRIKDSFEKFEEEEEEGEKKNPLSRSCEIVFRIIVEANN